MNSPLGCIAFALAFLAGAVYIHLRHLRGGIRRGKTVRAAPVMRDGELCFVYRLGRSGDIYALPAPFASEWGVSEKTRKVYVRCDRENPSVAHPQHPAYRSYRSLFFTAAVLLILRAVTLILQ